MRNPPRELPMVCEKPAVQRGWLPVSFGVKRSVDLSFVIGALLFAMPLLLLTALAILILQGRPILIRHKRVGKGGEPFLCLKFRTMSTNAEAILQQYLAQNAPALREWQAAFKLKNDPRVTWLGRFLRKSSLDELPQLWNILVGEMSVVGPRPIVEAEKLRYGMYIDHYCRVRPGLTGLWQVKGRSNTDYDTRVQLDVEYIGSVSLLRDLKIIALTIPAVLLSKGSY